MVITDFLTIFPEFSNQVTYPVPRVNFWLGFAQNFVDPTRWGVAYNQGVALYTAHLLVLDGRNSLTQGSVLGIDTGQSADGISYTVDSSSIVIQKAGMFNSTSYGIQYYQLAQMMGAGGIQFAS